MQELSKSFKILTVFLQIPEYIDFCIPELKALFSGYNIPLKELFKHEIPHDQFPNETYKITRKSFKNFPFVYLSIPDPIILKEIMNRSILIVAFLESLSEGSTYPELLKNIDPIQIEPYVEATEPFAFFVETHQLKISEPEKVEIMKKFECLNFKGKVNLRNFKSRFWVIENYSSHDDLKEGDKQTLMRIFFGREIIKKPRGGKKFHGIYDLTNRIFLGPTTADNDLAFLMANQAFVTKNDFVYDPFVGTGGLLIPTSHFGALSFGTEIDKRVLQGYRVGRLNKQSPYYKEHKDLRMDIWANFKQYSLDLPIIITMDIGVSHFRCKEFFDAIICDPPYGLRAPIKTSEKAKDNNEETKAENEENKNYKEDDIKSNKTCDDMIKHLFNLARDLLRKEGKLVFLYPVVKEKGFTVEDLPKDPDFELVDYAENFICSRITRLCITFKKK